MTTRTIDVCLVCVLALSGLATVWAQPPEELPAPIVTANSVEVCLNSRYSQHSLRGTANTQQISNIVWAAGRVPFTGAHRDIYVATRTATYLYDPAAHSLTWHSAEVTNDGAFAIIYESERDFDTGVSFMPALLASVSLNNSTVSAVASCPKGIGYPKARLIFGVQGGRGLTSELAVHCSIAEGEPGWLPDPCTADDNSLEEVLANLNYVDSFGQENLTVQQASQILWAGYGCSNHAASNGRAGLTVPSAWANYYLTRSIYLVNENGVFRYHNRNPDTNFFTRDHRLERVEPVGPPPRRSSNDVGESLRSAENDLDSITTHEGDDVRDGLRSAVDGLPRAPCYVVLCLDASNVGDEYARLEAGFVAGSMLVQASAIGLGCHFTCALTPAEQAGIRAATEIPASHVPQAVVSIGAPATSVSVSVGLQGDGRPDSGWAIPLAVKFFAPGADVLNEAPIYEFESTSVRSAEGLSAVCEVPGIVFGTYDVTVRGDSTLLNAKRGVVVSGANASAAMGTLLEGDANQDHTVNLADYAVLAMCWLASDAEGGYDIRADFDRNGLLDMADLYLWATNWLRNSPVDVGP